MTSVTFYASLFVAVQHPQNPARFFNSIFFRQLDVIPVTVLYMKFESFYTSLRWTLATEWSSWPLLL